MNVRPKSTSRRATGFTLVELLVVLIVLAVLAAIVLPKFVGSSTRAREARMKADLRLIRTAIDRFYIDTGAYPAKLADLAETKAPAKGLDSAGNQIPIDPLKWHGPYLDRIPKDAISGSDYVYPNALTGQVGTVGSSAPADATAADGTSYRNW